MNEATEWRAELGRRVAEAYVQDKKLAAAALGGSVARGWADRYSDVEVFVFWREAPAEKERLAAVERAGGRIEVYWAVPPRPSEYRALVTRTHGRMGQIWPYEDEEWSEHFFVHGVAIGVSGFLTETVEQYLVDVVKQADATDRKQILLSTVQHGQPLYGEERLVDWRNRAAYPDHLAKSIISSLLAYDDSWAASEMLAARQDLLALYPLLIHLADKILRILLALNHTYLPDPRFKWLVRLAGQLQYRPSGLAQRLKDVFQMEPMPAAGELQHLFEETLQLVETQMPQIDTEAARKWIRYRRPVWDYPPRPD
jgi:hypothetical protein